MLLRSIIFWGLNQPTSSRSKIPSSSIVSILHTLMAFYVTYQCDRIIKCQFTEKYHFAKFWISFGSVSLQTYAYEFRQASELQVRTHKEFKFLPFFEFKLEFGDEFSNFWLEIFWYFKFYRDWVCLKIKSPNLSLSELEIWLRKLIEFSSFE